MESNKLLKDLFLTMRSDYAGLDAKQKRHDPSPFVTMLGQAYYDRRMSSLLVLQAVSQYCAGMRDRNLKFALHDADYTPFSRGFAVRRCTEGMFVNLVTQETRLHPGDAVLAINRTAPKRIVQNLPKENPISTVMYLLVAVSCLLTMPVIIAGIAELLEKNCAIAAAA